MLKHSTIWVVLAALVVASAFWAPAFVVPRATGFGDWQMVHHNWEVGYVALTRFGEWALWNPFLCGGITAFGNPESQLFSPFFLLSFVFGTTLATKLCVVLHAFSGLLGMYFVGRELLGLRVPAAALAAVAWNCSGFFTWHIAGGHATFLPFFFAPCLLLAFRRAEKQPVYAVAVAALLALTLLEGGTYPFPYFLLLLGVDAASRLTRSRWAHVARSLLVSLGLAALLGAIRLLPIREALARTPRFTTSDDALTLRDFVVMLTAREHAWRFPPHEFVWPEYGTFVGWGVLVLAAAGVAIAWKRKQFWVCIGLVAFASLMLGQAGPFFPWPLLHHLPVFDSLRVPSRFAVLFTLYLVSCAALALDAAHGLLLRCPQRWRHLVAVAPWIIVALLCTDLFLVNLPIIDRWHGPPIASAPPAPSFRMTSLRDFHFRYASLPQQNVGVVQCYSGGMNWTVSNALRTNGTELSFERGHAELESLSRTINSVVVKIRASAPVRMILNQNFDPDWTSNRGAVIEDRGRLAVDLPAGTQTVRLRFWPRTLLTGLSLSALGATLCAGWLMIWMRRRAIANRR